eukprot:6610396-Alexandrium_andersonii.AAC.1
MCIRDRSSCSGLPSKQDAGRFAHAAGGALLGGMAITKGAKAREHSRGYALPSRAALTTRDEQLGQRREAAA